MHVLWIWPNFISAYTIAMVLIDLWLPRITDIHHAEKNKTKNKYQQKEALQKTVLC